MLNEILSWVYVVAGALLAIAYLAGLVGAIVRFFRKPSWHDGEGRLFSNEPPGWGANGWLKRILDWFCWWR